MSIETAFYKNIVLALYTSFYKNDEWKNQRLGQFFANNVPDELYSMAEKINIDFGNKTSIYYSTEPTNVILRMMEAASNLDKEN